MLLRVSRYSSFFSTDDSLANSFKILPILASAYLALAMMVSYFFLAAAR
jgi:hypothetical protein